MLKHTDRRMQERDVREIDRAVTKTVMWRMGYTRKVSNSLFWNSSVKIKVSN
jgi:hypothetical protein